MGLLLATLNSAIVTLRFPAILQTNFTIKTTFFLDSITMMTFLVRHVLVTVLKVMTVKQMSQTLLYEF